MIRLLLYTHVFSPSVGGVETVVQDLAAGLSSCRDAPEAPAVLLSVFTQTPAGAFDDSSLPFPVVRQPSPAQLKASMESADLIHVAGPSLLPMMLALLKRKPLVIEHHGAQALCASGELPAKLQSGHATGTRPSLRSRLLFQPRRWICRLASANVAPTQWLANQLALPNTVVIPHGLPAADVPPCAVGTNDLAAPVFLFVGRLIAAKGVATLLEAARLLSHEGKRFQVLIVGDGPERATLEASTQALKLDTVVRFDGSLPPAKVAALMESSTALVAPSICDEAFGMVLVEAMRHGLPVIASNIGAYVEVLGATGSHFKAGDPADLARCMANLLDHPAAREVSARAARERAATSFSQERMVREHVLLTRD